MERFRLNKASMVVKPTHKTAYKKETNLVVKFHKETKKYILRNQIISSIQWISRQNRSYKRDHPRKAIPGIRFGISQK